MFRRLNLARIGAPPVILGTYAATEFVRVTVCCCFVLAVTRSQRQPWTALLCVYPLLIPLCFLGKSRRFRLPCACWAQQSCGSESCRTHRTDWACRRLCRALYLRPSMTSASRFPLEMLREPRKKCRLCLSWVAVSDVKSLSQNMSLESQHIFGLGKMKPIGQRNPV